MWRTFLHSRYAPLLTHASLLALTLSMFVLLRVLPFWVAFLPAAIIQHRVGVLLHEYIHGIPFSRYRANLAILSVWDGLLLTFGMADLFRGTHLAHHRWLNTERDPAYHAFRERSHTMRSKVAALEGIQHLVYLGQALRGQHPDVIPSRIVLGAGLSLLSVGFWIWMGTPGMVVKLLVLTLYNTSIPISFRGAVEHHSHPGDSSFANEYRVVIPLFNLNKHIHHHESPHCPWYLLEYRTERPLWTLHYFTHWFRGYVLRDYVLRQPRR
jgi:fatty acid desaturase